VRCLVHVVEHLFARMMSKAGLIIMATKTRPAIAAHNIQLQLLEHAENGLPCPSNSFRRIYDCFNHPLKKISIWKNQKATKRHMKCTPDFRTFLS